MQIVEHQPVAITNNTYEIWVSHGWMPNIPKHIESLGVSIFEFYGLKLAQSAQANGFHIALFEADMPERFITDARDVPQWVVQYCGQHKDFFHLVRHSEAHGASFSELLRYGLEIAKRFDLPK